MDNPLLDHLAQSTVLDSKTKNFKHKSKILQLKPNKAIRLVFILCAVLICPALTLEIQDG